jgi:protein farnesyltransferase/geranylgeranyltransferase type-1 subunit alpha
MATGTTTMMIPIEDISEIFHDLTPISQDDDGLVCTIQYPSSFTLAYNYIRAVWSVNEFSDRSLKLSATCLKLNPANYTVWHFRRQCLAELKMMSNKESILQDLQLASTLGGSNPKNYQVKMLCCGRNDDLFLCHRNVVFCVY